MKRCVSFIGVLAIPILAVVGIASLWFLVNDIRKTDDIDG